MDFLSNPAIGLSQQGKTFLKRENLDLKKYQQLERAKILHYALITLALIFALVVGIYIIYWLSQEGRDIYPTWKEGIMWVIFGACVIIGLVACITLLFSIMYEKKIEAAITLNRSMSNIVADKYINPELHDSMGNILGNNANEGEKITNFFNKQIPMETPQDDYTENYRIDRNNLLSKINKLNSKIKNYQLNEDIKNVDSTNLNLRNQLLELKTELYKLEKNYKIEDEQLKNKLMETDNKRMDTYNSYKQNIGRNLNSSNNNYGEQGIELSDMGNGEIPNLSYDPNNANSNL